MTLGRRPVIPAPLEGLDDKLQSRGRRLPLSLTPA